jgi:hypothetical protein
LGKVYGKMGKAPSVIITFLIVAVGWAIFRIENLPDAFTFISRLFVFDFQTVVPIHCLQFHVTLILALLFAFITLLPFGKRLQDFVFYTGYSKKQHLVIWPISVLLFLFCLGALNAVGFSPFIYFRF